MLEAARAGLEEGSGGRASGVLAVTVPTSLTGEELTETGVAGSPGRQTARLAKLAAATGCEGVICSPNELGVIAQVAPGLLRVTPGIRPAGSSQDDQRRTATPTEALQRGADYLVIGRVILRASDPAAAARDILAAMT